MNGIKVSQLPEAVDVNNSDIAMIVQEGSSKKVNVENLLASKQDKLTAGDNIEIDGDTISATDTTYTAGTGIDITDGVISNTQTSAEWGNITGTLSNQTDLQNALDSKQATLVSGSNIKTINNSSVLGSGNINIEGTTTNNSYNNSQDETYSCDYINNNLELKGTFLYNNSSGTTGNITTFSDSINNYSYFEIISYVAYAGTNVYVTTGKLPVATIGRIHINSIFIGGTGAYNSGLSITSKRVAISGTSLSVVSDRQYNSGPNSQSDGNYTYITQVIGYK